MSPILVDKPEMTFVGLETSFIHARSPECNAPQMIGPLWGKYLHRKGEIHNAIGDVSYGVIYGRAESDRKHPHELQYIACRQVDSDHASPDLIPEGMLVYRVPAAKYACFIHKGPIEKITETLNAIYDGWLKTCEYEHAEIADIEIYDERFCMDDGSEMEYWISVKAKSTDG